MDTNEKDPINEPIEHSASSESRPSAKRDRFLPVSILVAAVLIAGALVFTSFYHGGTTPSDAGGTAPTNPSAQGTSPTVVSSTVMQLGSRDAILGNANAPVTLIEYGDYQCPYCGEFFSQTEPSIVSNYVNTGKVRMVFRDFAFLGAESIAAAEAAQCAEDQNKLWPYHDALYSGKVADDSKGGSEDDGYFNQALFLQIANSVGLNIPTFTSCVTGDKDASIVATEENTATSYGVNSTPTFFVNGSEISGAQPYSVFQTAIESALSAAAK
jgi:protein-disulfide isomerase